MAQISIHPAVDNGVKPGAQLCRRHAAVPVREQSRSR